SPSATCCGRPPRRCRATPPAHPSPERALLRDPVLGPVYVLVLGLLCGWMGFRLGWQARNRFLLPVLQGGMGFLAFLWAWTFARPLSAARAVTGWTLGTSFPAIGAFRRHPAAAEAQVL